MSPSIYGHYKDPDACPKLDLQIWITAIFLVLTSSKGNASVVMARILGVNQKTAWKLGHAVQELMDDREAVSTRLVGVVEVDEAYVGGTPKFKKAVKNKRGRGTGKPMVLVAADRNGQAKATLIPNAQGATLGPTMKEWIDPSSALMTDSNSTYRKNGRSFVSHHTVNHGKRQYSQPSKGAHTNTVEAVNSQVATRPDWCLPPPGPTTSSKVSGRNSVVLEPSPAGSEDQEPENTIRNKDDCHDGLETYPSRRADAGITLLYSRSAGSKNT